ncbi:hypothetical protein [Mucilaginibacter sp.]|uniref:hypothetical protein n=1 Tax=Mucilaginibacter sp. TaxID=1882438 RepID=UPI002638C0E6|nr:hypothetical protein [Mucilaginibacter sp.]
MRTLTLISRFYSGIFLPNFLVTLSCVYLHWSYGTKAHDLAGIFFWYKIITLAMIFYTAIHYKKQELYYYQNLGVTKWMLGIPTSVFDFLLWLAIYITACKTI